MNRIDRALRLLVDTVYNPEHHPLNIAGYCLLLDGRTDRTRVMFILSYQATQINITRPVTTYRRYRDNISQQMVNNMDVRWFHVADEEEKGWFAGQRTISVTEGGIK